MLTSDRSTARRMQQGRDAADGHDWPSLSHEQATGRALLPGCGQLDSQRHGPHLRDSPGFGASKGDALPQQAVRSKARQGHLGHVLRDDSPSDCELTDLRISCTCHGRVLGGGHGP